MFVMFLVIMIHYDDGIAAEDVAFASAFDALHYGF